MCARVCVCVGVCVFACVNSVCVHMLVCVVGGVDVRACPGKMSWLRVAVEQACVTSHIG